MSNYGHGHGHVYPRSDGVKARCGGPTLCKECALDQARKQRHDSDRQQVTEVYVRTTLKILQTEVDEATFQSIVAKVLKALPNP